MDFKVGDKVVYPNHGVGVIEQISFGAATGKAEKFYMLKIVSTGLRVMVPQTNITSVVLRRVIKSGEASKVLQFLEKGKFDSHHDWKYRFKENSERMRTGSLLEVAVVLKSLLSLSRSKPLSFREKKMLERAKHLLVTELATVGNKTEDAIAAYDRFLAEPEATRVGDDKLLDARTRLDELKAKLVAAVTIVTTPPGATVAVDGNPEPGVTPLTLKLVSPFAT